MGSPMDLPGKESFRSSHADLSPAATTIAFDPVLPLVRVPVPAGEGDDPHKGAYVLAYRSEEAWRNSWLNCADKISTRCEAGAKVGCSISAAKACGAPWWKAILPFLKTGHDDQSKREECEEREMMGCMMPSQEQCTRYARETCDPVFANIKIAVPGAPIDPRFNGRQLRRPRVSRHDKIVPKAIKKNHLAEQVDTLESPIETLPTFECSENQRPQLGMTTFQGRLLMQNQRVDGRERPSIWSSKGTEGINVSLRPPSSLEGWVGGLVHPGVVKSTPVVADSNIPEFSVLSGLEWWQKLQRLVAEKFSF